MATGRPLGFWLKLLDGLIDGQFVATLGEHGLTRRQWQVLNVLTPEAGASRASLQEALAPFLTATEAGSLDTALAGLLADHWVQERADGVLALTEEGRASLGRLREVVDRTRGTVAQGITAEEYDQTLRVLERMARNLGWTDLPAR